MEIIAGYSEDTTMSSSKKNKIKKSLVLSLFIMSSKKKTIRTHPQKCMSPLCQLKAGCTDWKRSLDVSIVIVCASLSVGSCVSISPAVCLPICPVVSVYNILPQDLCGKVPVLCLHPPGSQLIINCLGGRLSELSPAAPVCAAVGCVTLAAKR